MARSSLSLVVLALAAAIPVGHWMARPATAAPRGTVVDVALADPRFSTPHTSPLERSPKGAPLP